MLEHWLRASERIEKRRTMISLCIFDNLSPTPEEERRTGTIQEDFPDDTNDLHICFYKREIIEARRNFFFRILYLFELLVRFWRSCIRRS